MSSILGALAAYFGAIRSVISDVRTCPFHNKQVTLFGSDHGSRRGYGPSRF